jgi:hypothetical protein
MVTPDSRRPRARSTRWYSALVSANSTSLMRPKKSASTIRVVYQDLLRECRILVLAMITTWRRDRGDQLPNGRQLGTEWISQIRAALNGEQVARDIRPSQHARKCRTEVNHRRPLVPPVARLRERVVVRVLTRRYDAAGR